MQITSVGFIGAGRVARIILGGWKKAGNMPSKILLFDSNLSVSEKLKSLGPEIAVTARLEEAVVMDLVFLAVHPPVLKDVLGLMEGNLKNNSIVVSLAPKFTIEQIVGKLGGFNRVTRLIPNAPSIVGQGYNPLVFSPFLGEQEKQALRNILTPLGDCPEVDEHHLEAFAILSAMGPTYFWPQLFTLLSLAEGFGLSIDEAARALDKMLWGTMATLKNSGLSPDHIQDLVPVKPMAEEIQVLCESYNQKLKDLMEKIRP